MVPFFLLHFLQQPTIFRRKISDIRVCPIIRELKKSAGAVTIYELDDKVLQVSGRAVRFGLWGSAMRHPSAVWRTNIWEILNETRYVFDSAITSGAGAERHCVWVPLRSYVHQVCGCELADGAAS
jgi:hypothetical protein